MHPAVVGWVESSRLTIPPRRVGGPIEGSTQPTRWLPGSPLDRGGMARGRRPSTGRRRIGRFDPTLFPSRAIDVPTPGRYLVSLPSKADTDQSASPGLENCRRG